MSGKALRAEEEIRGLETLRSEKFSMFRPPQATEVTHLLREAGQIVWTVNILNAADITRSHNSTSQWGYEFKRWM